MVTANKFCAELGRQFALTPSEQAFFRAAGVSSFDATHNLLFASLNPVPSDIHWSPVDRRAALAHSLLPLLSNRYRAALAKWSPAEPHATGAAAPSAAALSVTVPSAPRSILNKQHVALLHHAVSPLSQAPAIDLLGDRHTHWLIKDQGLRQTCVAFAIAACIELLRAGQGTSFEPVSPQFLYWHMRNHPWPGPMPPGWEEGATKLDFARRILADKGICSLGLCEYSSDLVPLEGPKPTEIAEADALNYLIANGCYLDAPNPNKRPPNLAKRIYDLLRQGHPVAIAVPVFPLIPGNPATTFNSPWTLLKGEVSDPPPHTSPSSGHAVCVIGFQRGSAGGWFIFRNSVGLNYATELDPLDTTAPIVPAAGYGAISARYVEDYCWELFSPKLT